jgi:hypothetical protein
MQTEEKLDKIDLTLEASQKKSLANMYACIIGMNHDKTAALPFM